jgi:AraC-like DNA-binding protein
LINRWKASGLWPQDPQPAPLGRDWGAFFDTIIEQSKRVDNWGKLKAINLLENLLLQLAEARNSPSSTGEAWLELVLDYLSANSEDVHCRETPQYDVIAAEVGMSLGTLRRRFKEATGTPLHTYYLQTRLAHAQTLLEGTDLPLKQIATSLGYSNVQFFSRQFRELSGVSPGTYRRSRQS